MKLASNIHTNSIQIHFGFDLKFLKPSPIASFKNVPARIVLPCRSLRRRNLTAHNFTTITCSSRTDRDAREASASENVNEAFRSQSHEGADDGGERSCVDASYAVSGEKVSASEDYATSFRTVGLCVFSAVAFGVGLSFKDGVGKASEFFAGYLLEQSLSVDNLFVFVLIFKYFKVPLSYQKLVLSYGISGAVVFRLLLILLGTATIQRFEAINLLLATVLLYSSFKLFSEDHEDTDLSDNLIVKTCQKFIPVTSNYDGDRFLTIQDGVWKATPLLLTVAVIELSDLAFAVDSIPAVLGVTRDPFIVFSSNLFAILGLRSYFTLISESMEDLKYLQPAVGVVLGFIGCKMILDFFGLHISTETSLELVATTLITGVLLSLVRKTR